jgi:hypothetical protein
MPIRAHRKCTEREQPTDAAPESLIAPNRLPCRTDRPLLLLLLPLLPLLWLLLLRGGIWGNQFNR